MIKEDGFKDSLRTDPDYKGLNGLLFREYVQGQERERYYIHIQSH
jgi:hypothetical protein